MLSEFDDKPLAAASIGQVHKGVLLDGREVAIKIQVESTFSSLEGEGGGERVKACMALE